MFKKILVHTKKGIKFIILFIIAVLLIVGAIAYLYKPTYSVWLDGEEIGYTENKSKLQHTINEYVENGDGTDNVAFVQVDKLPEYKLCLLKKDVVTNDDEIINQIKDEGVAYYRYYAIAVKGEEKAYVANFDEAENVVNGLKEKNSDNINDITILEKYETSLAELSSTDDVITKLYVAKPVVAKTTKPTGTANTARSLSANKVNLGINLIRPISGIITSRFGSVSGVRSGAHTGLDIAASSGTPIKAAAEGTVTFSGRKGSYGNMIVITHSNGVQTYYCHCSVLYVTAGETVAQGQVIAAVGTTGNSTGPHLHLEIRVNGVAYNPQNYLY